MADYPNTITDPRVVANKPGTEYDAAKTTRLFAEDHNGLADEIVAIETELGTNPKGEYDDVADFLNALDTIITKFLNQAVKSTSKPTFAGINIAGASTIVGDGNWIKIETPNSTLYLNYDNPTRPVRIGKSGYSTEVRIYGNLTSAYKSSDGSAGISTTFEDANGKTFTVKDGIITAETAP